MPNLYREATIRRQLVWTALLFLLLLLAAPGLAAEAAAPLRLAILPCTDVVKTFAKFQGIAGYLRRQLDREVEIIVPTDYPQFIRTISRGKADYAFVSPHIYVALADHFHRDSILQALTPEGETTFHGVFVTRTDSDITGLDDLRGRSVMFGSELSSAKWLAPMVRLRESGINVETDLRDLVHGGSCEDIALNVYLGAVDAGLLCNYSFAEIASGAGDGDQGESAEEEFGALPPNSLRVISTTDPLPTWVLAPLNHLDQATITEVNTALLALSPDNAEHREIMEDPEIGGFIKGNDATYQAQVRRFTTPEP